MKNLTDLEQNKLVTEKTFKGEIELTSYIKHRMSNYSLKQFNICYYFGGMEEYEIRVLYRWKGNIKKYIVETDVV